MKHIVLYSGGAASAYVSYLVLQEQDKKDVILLHTPTLSEHKDAERFRLEVARYLQHPITTWGDGRDIWQLIDDNNCIPGQFIPFCTTQLKQKMSDEYYKYLDSIGEDYIVYLGFDIDEWRRIQKVQARFDSIGRKVKFPLWEKKIGKDEPKRIIKNEWEIQLPKAYDHLKHNNCIPCFKAGKRDFYLYWRHYREEFDKAVKAEEKIGYTVFKDTSLKDLAKVWEHNARFECAQVNLFDDEDNTPCECIF